MLRPHLVFHRQPALAVSGPGSNPVTAASPGDGLQLLQAPARLDGSTLRDVQYAHRYVAGQNSRQLHEKPSQTTQEEDSKRSTHTFISQVAVNHLYKCNQIRVFSTSCVTRVARNVLHLHCWLQQRNLKTQIDPFTPK